MTANVPHQIWLTGIQVLFFTKIITREKLHKGNLPQQAAIPFSKNKSKILAAPICFHEGPNLRFSYDKDQIFQWSKVCKNCRKKKCHVYSVFISFPRGTWEEAYTRILVTQTITWAGADSLMRDVGCRTLTPDQSTTRSPSTQIYSRQDPSSQSSFSQVCQSTVWRLKGGYLIQQSLEGQIHLFKGSGRNLNWLGLLKSLHHTPRCSQSGLRQLRFTTAPNHSLHSCSKAFHLVILNYTLHPLKQKVLQLKECAVVLRTLSTGKNQSTN